MIQKHILSKLNRLRLLVGLVGGKKIYKWWDCSFMDETGIRFLENSFPRTASTAAIQSTTEAAQRVHDGALGKIGCYHLFRLPIQIEDRMLNAKDSDQPLPSRDEAMAELAGLAEASIDAPEGPVQVGVERKILTETSIRELAAHYHSAFSKGLRCYPYFSADA